MRTVLTNGTVIDGTGREPMSGSTIVMEDGRIKSVSSEAYVEESGNGQARVFDLEGGYVLPGLWSVHTHFGQIFPDRERRVFTESPIETAIRAGRNCMDALRVGITGLRTTGERDFLDVAWKRAFEAGLFVGPRLFACGHVIIATGGHAHDWPMLVVEVDGPFEMRKAVRDQLKHGVDQIKLCVTGGVATAGEGMQESQMQLDEIRAATDVAHEKGKRVLVHAGGPEGVKRAIEGGVDCIEHGYYLDDEAISMMAENGTYFVPTLFVTQYPEFMRKSGMEEHQIAKASTAAEAHREGFQKALEAGVKIACGPDSSPIAEHTLVEIELLVKSGMTEMQAIRAATETCAELCEVEDQVGTVEEGKLADIIVLGANPLDDISNVRQLKLVFKEGNLVETEPPEGLREFWEIFWG